MKIKRCLFTFAISAAVLLVLLGGMDFWSSPSRLETVKILSNGFAVVGVVLFFFGILLWVDRCEGFRGFKLIVYGAKKFFYYVLPFLFSAEMEPTFFDYYTGREKEKIPVGHLMICGGLYLALSCALAVVFERMLSNG